ncbi:NlpC/P60 family protein [Nonomuraea sp. NPDC050404]|uniref:bifunctional WXG100 family type VII secretion target/C40 family peptidase n=1 Tax=Nonomuraea sp. NPDC050404 TaxID=3155783 RepID=UPI0033D9851B
MNESMFYAILQQIESASPSAIRAFATRWTSAAEKAGGGAGRLNTAVGNVDSGWNGDSAQAFVTYMGQYHKAGLKLKDALTSVSTALNDVAGTVETVQGKFATMRTEVQGLTGQDRTKKILEELLPKAMDLEGQVNKSVATALNTIKEQVDSHMSGFGKIEAPSKQSWQPSDGQSVGWTPVTTTPTALQSGNGGNPGASPASYNGGGGDGPGPAAGGGAPPTPLTFAPGTATGDKIVEAARTHIGKPYVWGANGPSAFDCSGLVYYVLNQAGIKIDDTTAAGYQATGQPVSNPQPGDMVFFGQPASHVGVYIGDGKMIHAPRPGSDVVEASVAADGRSVSYRRFTA